ncbi:GTP-binding protein [Fusarium heterosporum]|uniref:GTP-binding protein n=1 Tax=Fusarium heterosporum TaxID=42747 RepID=A0A8H5WM22_FUSHE|nr:GTP-binding protein [Fusarium heterosporum]
MSVSVNSKILGQLSRPEAETLLGASDSLTPYGVKIVNVPQIVVVGAQSAGKSSVLQAITHIRFPDHATRFATELNLRRASEARVDVNVKFADQSKPPKSFKRDGFQEDDLLDIIEAATECMDLGTTETEISQDVLCIDIQGPELHTLSLVDLPGLSSDREQKVDDLIERYMGQQNSLIVVVLAADDSDANCATLEKAKRVDPQGQRTFGVITKPDLAPAGSDVEQKYLAIARGQDAAFESKLGWHVLHNGSSTTSFESRDEDEVSFFQQGAWAKIPTETRGVLRLRKKLRDLLYIQMRRSLPEAIADIQEKLKVRREKLEKLGTSRSSPEHMRSFLLGVAADYQRLLRDALHGRYNDEFFGGLNDGDHKLRAQLRNFGRALDHVLRTRGSAQVMGPDGESTHSDDVPEYIKEFLIQYPYDFPDAKVMTREELRAQLERQVAVNQGRKLSGVPDSELLVQLFKQQAASWKPIAEYHVELVATVVKAFVDQVFVHVAGPLHTNQTTEMILTEYVDEFFESAEDVMHDKIDELLRPYLEGYALPLDLESDRAEYGTDKVLDIVQAHYERSRHTFVDNVTNFAVQGCLIRGLPGLVTPQKIGRLSDERVEEMAAEPSDWQSQRESLQEEIKILEQGLGPCKRYKPRAMTVPSIRNTPASTNSAPKSETSDASLDAAKTATPVAQSEDVEPTVEKPKVSETEETATEAKPPSVRSSASRPVSQVIATDAAESSEPKKTESVPAESTTTPAQASSSGSSTNSLDQTAATATPQSAVDSSTVEASKPVDSIPVPDQKRASAAFIDILPGSPDSKPASILANLHSELEKTDTASPQPSINGVLASKSQTPQETSKAFFNGGPPKPEEPRAVSPPPGPSRPFSSDGVLFSSRAYKPRDSGPELAQQGSSGGGIGNSFRVIFSKASGSKPQTNTTNTNGYFGKHSAA